MGDEMFRRILERFGYSWRGYRRVRRGVEKRLRKHMQQLVCADLPAYFDKLNQDPDLMKDFERLLERLDKGGFLIIGAHEKLPQDGSALSLRPSHQNASVFQKHLERNGFPAGVYPARDAGPE